MENDLEQPSEPVEPCEPSLVQLFGRRAFIVSVATAVSAAAFWGLRRSTVAAARPMTPDEGPKTVTIIEFSADGKQTDTVSLPRLIKSDGEWKKMLSPTSYRVTRQFGNQVRLRYRLAQFLAAHRARECRGYCRRKPDGGPHRSLLQAVRRSPRARVQ